jgi:hypothetical protein
MAPIWQEQRQEISPVAGTPRAVGPRSEPPQTLPDGFQYHFGVGSRYRDRSGRRNRDHFQRRPGRSVRLKSQTGELTQNLHLLELQRRI